ncbi:MAG: hypothetical protein ABEJ00_03475, partial [Gemmatimonadota bacterium]
MKASGKRKGPVGPVALVAAALALAACGEAGGGADPPRRITIPTGTELRLTLDQELGPAASEEGDRFTARVAEPVTVGGRVAIPRGAVVHGYVLGVEERAGGGELALGSGRTPVAASGPSSRTAPPRPPAPAAPWCWPLGTPGPCSPGAPRSGSSSPRRFASGRPECDLPGIHPPRERELP